MSHDQPQLATVNYEYLTDISPQDKPWDKHRGEALSVGQLYRQNEDFVRYSDRIDQCSRRLQFALVPEDEGVSRLKLHAARFCRVRHCPVCQWRKAMMWRARFFQGLPQYLADNPTLIPVFLTLTARNCALDELRATVDHLSGAFSKLTRRRSWPGVAWVRSLEVTRGDNGSAHPHLHVLLFVRPGYFGKGYISQPRWRSLWQECLKIDYLPVVHVARVKANKGDDSDIRIAILETLKYGVKPEDLVADAEWLYGITRELHNVRSVSIGGDLKGYLKESEPEDLIHDEKVEDEDLEDLKDCPQLIFDFLEIVKRYTRKAEDEA
jgi:plasmid rolling circle replication initiator protein Rep